MSPGELGLQRKTSANTRNLTIGGNRSYHIGKVTAAEQRLCASDQTEHARTNADYMSDL